MKALTVEERIQLIKNLLEDPDDYLSYELLALANQFDDKQQQSTSNGDYIDDTAKK